MNSVKVEVTLESLKKLARTARATGTEDHFIAAAIQWAESSSAEMNVLRVRAERLEAAIQAVIDDHLQFSSSGLAHDVMLKLRAALEEEEE